jgi:osmotically inducible protein OsmC
MADRSATASWNGTLAEGGGTVSLTTSGVLRDAAISWRARTAQSEGQTSPEEMLAGAHAACFAMAFTNTLVKAGHQPQGVDVTATCSFEQGDGGWSVTRMHLEAEATVPGIDDAAYQDLAAQAKASCPISRAIANNVEISLDARLA